MLKSESITFSYDNSYHFSFPNIHLYEGENLLILGDSGIGKTTLIQILAGLLRPASGIVELNGTNFEDLRSKELDQLRSDIKSGNTNEVLQKLSELVPNWKRNK